MHFRWPIAVVLLSVLLPFAWCLGTTLIGQRVCTYRDSGNFYYPLYAWTWRTWQSGEVPLWNPQDGIGTPVVAEATSALFYPGQLVFALPLDYSFRFSLYIASHLLLAAGGAYALAHCLLRQSPSQTARRLSEHAPSTHPELRHLAAGLCGLSYAFSGAVLFQYCNVVFLVGAAWLPLASLSAIQMLSQRRFRWAWALGACLALMTLGGDPQAAYHAGLLAALWAWFQRPAKPHTRSSLPTVDTCPRKSDLGLRHHALSLLATAAISGACLSAVQVVPASLWTRGSDRATFAYPRSIYEIPTYLRREEGQWPTPGIAAQENGSAHWSGVAQGLLGKPVSHTHHQQIYAFSVAPWRLCEFFWPGFSGRMFPTNQRWLSALRAEDRIWTPTLYLGLLPLLIGLLTWRPRATDRRISWLSWVVCGSLVGSFGWYAPGWILGVLQATWTGEPPGAAIGEPTGGLYWLMVTVLPGYAYFRYPAKLLVIASLATALLAAIGFERLLTSDRRRLQRSLAVVGLGSVAVMCLLGVCGPWWSHWFRGSTPDELYGPLDCRGAWLGCLAACGHATILCALCWWLLGRTAATSVQMGALLLILTATELGWANGATILTAPTTALHTDSVLANQRVTPADNARIYRPPRRSWVPTEWAEEPRIDRAAVTVRWDRTTLLPKYHLLGSWGSVDSLNTLVPRDYRAYLEADGKHRPHPHLLHAIATRHFILPAEEEWPAAMGARIDTVAEAANARVWHNVAAFPRVWIVHQIEYWPYERSSDPAAIGSRFHAMLFPKDQPRDLRRQAIVETAHPDPLPPGEANTTVTSAETCHLVSQRACRLEVDTTLTTAGLLVLSNLYESGWAVHITSGLGGVGEREPIPGEIVRTNGVMQGVFLPAGHHRLVFQYKPRPLYWAAAISAGGWLLWLGVLVLGIRTRAKNGNRSRPEAGGS